MIIWRLSRSWATPSAPPSPISLSPTYEPVDAINSDPHPFPCIDHGIVVAGSLRPLPLRSWIWFVVQEPHMAQLRPSGRWFKFPDHTLPSLRAPSMGNVPGRRGSRSTCELGCPSQRGQTGLHPCISRLRDPRIPTRRTTSAHELIRGEVSHAHHLNLLFLTPFQGSTGGVSPCSIH